jgi:hypothetical protein
MNLWEDDHFRCEILFRQVPNEHSENIILDTSPLRQTKCQWLVEGKVLLLEFQGKRIPYIFEKLWDKIAAQSDNIISATIYKWDVLDQHPGTRTVFSRSIKGESD